MAKKNLVSAVQRVTSGWTPSSLITARAAKTPIRKTGYSDRPVYYSATRDVNTLRNLRALDEGYQASKFKENMNTAAKLVGVAANKMNSTSAKNYASSVGGANYGNYAGMSGFTAGSAKSTSSNNIYDLQAMNDYNNWLNIQMMREQNAFNAQQAQLQRDFEQNMSNTAHQREVADLKAAGLNPVLSANAGASTPAGSAAMSGNWVGADTSTVSALAQVLAATLGANATMTAAGINAAASRDVAGINLAGTEYSANKSYSSAKYMTDIGRKTALQSAGISLVGDVLNGILGLNPYAMKSAFGSKNSIGFV